MFDIINTDPFLLFFGGFYIVLGLSCLFTRKPWEEFMDLFIEHDSLSLVMGILVLPISLAIIVFYNSWDGLAPIILMVIGYLAFLKALAMLMKPSLMQGLLKKEFVRKWMWLDGFSGIALGLALLVL
ncbi:MAG: hypothetical protein DHS20C02_04140 [Micavibrio sp.]|nr:MAG: hypothetical protein DHS20C02_04140 [Micavibrio sp.]